MIPRQDDSSLGQLPTRTTPHQDNKRVRNLAVSKEPWDISEVIRDKHGINKNIPWLGPQKKYFSRASSAAEKACLVEMTPNWRMRKWNTELVYSPPGQLPTRTTPHLGQLPTRTTPTRTFPHHDSSPPGQFPTRTSTHQDKWVVLIRIYLVGSCPGGEMSRWGSYPGGGIVLLERVSK